MHYLLVGNFTLGREMYSLLAEKCTAYWQGNLLLAENFNIYWQEIVLCIILEMYGQLAGEFTNYQQGNVLSIGRQMYD